MTEKNIVLRDLRVSYNGTFNLDDFISEVDKWLNQNGYEKEHKKYTHHLEKKGKKIEIVIEGHKELSKWYTGTLRLRALFNNLKEISLTVKGKKIRADSAEALIYIDGIMETHLKESIYHSKPLYQFIIQLIDKFIYKFWTDKHVGDVVSDGTSFYKQIRAFFSLQKYKFQE